MKSIKPGREPSKFSAAGSILVAVIGVFWCIAAGALGAWFLIPFGLAFVGFAVYQFFYHYHNATSEDRYSVFDIVDSEEEAKKTAPDGTKARYCPYCGKPVEGDYAFCPGCGKKLPD